MGNNPPKIMGNNPPTTGEPKVCMSSSYYEALMKNSITLEKVVRANKIINDATEDFGDNMETPFPFHHHKSDGVHLGVHSGDNEDSRRDGVHSGDNEDSRRDGVHSGDNEDSRRDGSERESNDDGPEGYQYPQVIPNDLILKETGLPITSEVTKSFQQAKHIRSPYDKYWLNIYNNHAKKTDYNL
jgi:hypothetical protein